MRTTLFRQSLAAACVAAALLFTMVGCSGGGEKSPTGINPPPPAKEVVTVSTATATVAGNSVLLSASAVSSKTGLITEGWRYAWTVNGVSAGTGMNLSVSTTSLAPGSYPACVTVVGSDPNVSGTSCPPVFVVEQTTISLRVVAAGSSVMQANYVGLRVWVTSSDGTVKDSASLAADGTATITGVNATKLRSGVSFIVDAIDPTKRAYARRVGSRKQTELVNGLNLVVIPLSWKIEAGVYAGQTINDLITRAFAWGWDNDGNGVVKNYSNLAGCYLISGVENCNHIDSWPLSSLPLPLALKQGQQAPIPGNPQGENWSYTQAMTPEKEAMMAAMAQRVNELVGFQVVRIATPPEVNIRSGAAYQLDSAAVTPARWAGISGYAADSLGNIKSGGMSFWNLQSMTPRVAMHEMGHVFGLGHAAPLNDLMSLNRPLNIVEFSAEEITVFILKLKVHDLEVRLGDHRAMYDSWKSQQP